MILFLSVYPTKNLGDEFCSPAHYFTFGEPLVRAAVTHEEIVEKLPSPNAVIVGGGGLIAPFALENLRAILDFYKDKCPIIGWGLGFNFHFDRSQPVALEHVVAAQSNLLNGFDMLGIRDHSTPYEWVPCVSCLHPVFAQKSAPVREFVIYEHRDAPISIPDIPKMNNFSESLKEVVEFLSSGECVITNSYHGVYWATLLNRKVICIPFSSRFMSMKFPPVYLNDVNDYKGAAKRANTYPGAREICIRQNLNFYNRVMNEIV